MTGFSAAWLALREPADHRARNAAVRDSAIAHLAGKAAPRLVDLGCGSGSNLRALAPHLPSGQIWRLVDADPLLLQAARQALTLWADRTEAAEGGALMLWREGKRIEVHFEEADLARDLDAVLDRHARGLFGEEARAEGGGILRAALGGITFYARERLGDRPLLDLVGHKRLCLRIHAHQHC